MNLIVTTIADTGYTQSVNACPDMETAIMLARKLSAQGRRAYIEFYSASDGQNMYLNPDMTHDHEGKAW